MDYAIKLTFEAMAACNFSIPFTGPAQNVIDKARSAVQGQNGTFNGDTNGGLFEVSVFGNAIRGSYSIFGSTMNVVIDNKPFLLPCSAIEGFLKSQLGGAPNP